MINKLKQLNNNLLPGGLLEVLLKLQANSAFKDFYLAGGTALTLQIGHRTSVDLDLFSSTEFKSGLVNKLEDKYQTISLSDNSIEVSIDSNKVFFFYFAFPLYKPIIIQDGLRLADPIDIGLMKLLALQGRSLKKDIIDLYYIDQEILPLEKLLLIFEKQYPKESFNAYSSIKTLLDKEELEPQPMPQMKEPFDWNKAFQLVSSKLIKHITSFIK